MTCKFFLFISCYAVFISATTQDNTSPDTSPAIKELKDNINKLNDKIGELANNQKQLSSLQATITKLQNDLNECQSTSKQVESLINDFNNFKSVSNQINSIQSQIKNMESLTNDFSDLKKKQENISKQLANMSKLDDIVNDIKTQASQIKKLEENMNNSVKNDGSNINTNEIDSKLSKNEENMKNALKISNDKNANKFKDINKNIQDIKTEMGELRKAFFDGITEQKFEDGMREIRKKLKKVNKNITNIHEMIGDIGNNKKSDGNIEMRVSKLESLTFENRLNMVESYLKYGIGEAMDYTVMGYNQLQIYYKQYKMDQYISKIKKTCNDAYKKLVNKENEAKINKFKKEMNKFKKEKMKDIKKYYKQLLPIIKKKYKLYSNNLNSKIKNFWIELAKQQWYKDFRTMIRPFMKEAGIDDKYEHTIARSLLIIIVFLSIIILIKLFLVMVNCCCPVIDNDSNDDNTPDVVK